MRGKDGVLDTTRLVRSKPFGEWVTVYFDSAQIDEAALLELIKSKRCPRAKHVRDEGASQVMNPYVAAGDAVQIRLDLDKKTTLKTALLPEGWNLLELKPGAPLAKGVGYVWVQVPKAAKQEPVVLELSFGDGSAVEASVTVARQVGKH